MPNRIIREAILFSEKVCSLGWPEEVLFRRLMSIVDDYGRHEAHPQLLRSKCYPMQTDTVRVADITRWLAACQKAGVLVLYEVSGKVYLQIENFGQQLRSASKCPEPKAAASSCNQLPADAHLGVSVAVSELNNSLSREDDRLAIDGLLDHHPDDWQPDLGKLAAYLKRAAVPMPADLSNPLTRFNLHNAGKALSENQRYSKLVTWLTGDYRREQQRTPSSIGNTAPRKLTAAEQIEQDCRAGIAALRTGG